MRTQASVRKAIAAARKVGVQHVNLKFVDLVGKWHQVTLPISNFGPHIFEKGVAFDGSSVAGFTRLESGDLKLVPDPGSYFFETAVGQSVSFICDSFEADTGRRFPRDPRYVIEKSERFLAQSGVADQAFFMPELEFNLFDQVEVLGLPGVTGYKITSEEAGIGVGVDGKIAPWIGEKRGYHAVPPADRLWSLRCDMVRVMEQAGIPIKYCHHEVGSAGQCEIEIRPNLPRITADRIMIGKYLVKTIAAREGIVATFIPKPLYEQPGNGMHFHQHLLKRGRNIFFKKGGYGNLSPTALSYIGGLLKHGRALLALTCASTNSYRRLVPGFEAPTCFVYAVGNRSAAVRIPKGIDHASEARLEFRPSDASGNPYLSIAGMLMAGIDGIRRKIDLEKEGFGPYDLDVFSLDEIEEMGIARVPYTLEEALEALKKDHQFLLEGDVFTEELIRTWIELKYEEARSVGRRTHPYEIDLYLDC